MKKLTIVVLCAMVFASFSFASAADTLVPLSDVSNESWKTQGGSPWALYASVDESVSAADDATTYAVSASSSPPFNLTDRVEFFIDELAGNETAVILEIRFKWTLIMLPGSSKLRLNLHMVNGESDPSVDKVATLSLDLKAMGTSGDWQTATLALTSAQIAEAVASDDLRLRLAVRGINVQSYDIKVTAVDVVTSQ